MGETQERGEILRVKKVVAEEIHLVAGDGKCRFVISSDAHGYPKIIMGDLEGVNDGGLRRIEIGFSINSESLFPYVVFGVNREGAWEGVTMAVLD